MEAFVLAAALVLTAQNQIPSLVKADCSDCDDLFQLKSRLDALAWKFQDVTSMQHKMRTLERKVQLRDENARTLERRLKATEGDLGAVKVELDRRQRGVNSMVRERAGGTEPETTETDAGSVEEWLKKEKKDRLVFEAKMKSTIEGLAQRQKETSKRLAKVLEKIDNIQEVVTALEFEKTQLELTVEEVKVRMEMAANASEERKPPPRTGQSRVKLNDFLKDVEELKLFETAANYSDLMGAVEEVSGKVASLSLDAEHSRRKLKAITDYMTNHPYPENLEDLKNEMLSNFTEVWKEVVFLRKLLENDKPWEQYFSQEMEGTEKKLKLEMDECFRKLKNDSLKVSNNVMDLRWEMENVTKTLEKLKDDFAESEEKRKNAQEFRRELEKHLEDVEMDSPIQQMINGRFSIQNDDAFPITEKNTLIPPQAAEAELTPDAPEGTLPSLGEESTKRSEDAPDVRKLEAPTVENGF